METLERLLRDALAVPTQARRLVVHLPVPTCAAPRLLALEGAAAFLWAPPDDVHMAGWGSAWAASTAELSSFASLRTATAAVLREVEERALTVQAAPPSRVFTALPFRLGRATGSVLQDGAAMLPRWRYTTDGRAAQLAVCVSADEARAADGVVAEWRRVQAALETDARPPALPACAGVVPDDPSSFATSVAHATAEIRSGRLQKVVLARRTRIELAAPPRVADVLARLTEEAAWGAAVALRTDGGSFVAVTPERLVRRTGRRVQSEALAGTAGWQPEAQARLASSRKDAMEQGWVVRAIAAALAPLCTELDVPECPDIRALRHVSHLHTPITGELREPVHALSLAAALHPTPAVGGAPRDRALAWIEAHEPSPRGLYAGPVGWVDRDGDGDFWVALRGGLIEGAIATTYAGAGIVDGSVPAEELHETEGKARGFLRALGALR